MAGKIKWEHCPRCGSNKVKDNDSKYLLIILGIIVGINVLNSLLFNIAGLIAGVYSVFKLFFSSEVRCRDCNFEWKPPYDAEQPSYDEN